MPEYKGNFKTLVTLKADDSGKLPKEIKVLPLGRWMTEPYGEMEVTSEHIASMVKNFEAGVRGDELPVDVDHDGGKAAGWFKKLEAKDDGLYADVDWTTYGEELLKTKQYKLFSPEWSFDYRDPLTLTPYGPMLIAGSLTNRPLFKQLPKLVASEVGANKDGDLTSDNSIVIIFSEGMKLEDILKKAKKDLSTGELDFLKKNEAKLSEADKKKFLANDEPGDGEGEGNPAGDGEGQPTEPNPETPATPAPQADPQKDNTANDKAVTIKASELETLKANAEAGKKAMEQLTLKATEEKFQTYVAGEKLLPRQKEAFVAFVANLSEAAKADFYKFCDDLPKHNIAKEAGDEDSSHLTAQKELDKLIDEGMKKANETGEKTDRNTIMKNILRTNAELAQRLDDEGGSQ